MAEKNVILKDGEDILYPKTKAELVEGLPQGGAEWGGITGTLADQTDLQTALDGKLSLSGGTMTGALSTTSLTLNNFSATIYRRYGSWIIRAIEGGDILIGDGSPTGINFQTNGNLTRTVGANRYNILDAHNTEANATLAGTEADLTSLKLNGTTYKIPSGGGGGGNIVSFMDYYGMFSSSENNYVINYDTEVVFETNLTQEGQLSLLRSILDQVDLTEYGFSDGDQFSIAVYAVGESEVNFSSASSSVSPFPHISGLTEYVEDSPSHYSSDITVSDSGGRFNFLDNLAFWSQNVTPMLGVAINAGSETTSPSFYISGAILSPQSPFSARIASD